MTARLAAGQGDDRRLPVVLLGVQHLVLDAGLLEHAGQDLRLGHRRRADQHRLPVLVPLRHVGDDGGELGFLRAVDQVPLVDPDHVLVGRDRHHTQAVDLLELRRLGQGRARHAGELVVHPEVVLQGDGGEGLVLLADLHPLLRLDGLVQPLVVAPADEGATGVLVDDQDLAVQVDVVPVELEQLLGLDGVVQVGDERGVGGLVEVVDAQPVLDHVDAGLEDGDRLLLLVDLVVPIALEPVDQLGEGRIPLVGVLRRTGDDQRRPGLVDQDRVHLVHDREVMTPLDAVVQGERHVVAEVVEAELVVRAVRDVGVVGASPGSGVHLGQDRPDLEAQEVVDPAHLLGLELRQVVVHRDDVDALAGDARSGTTAASRPASCPHRSSSRRCCPGAARHRPSAGRRSAASPAPGDWLRAPWRTTRAATSPGSRRSRTAA